MSKEEKSKPSSSATATVELVVDNHTHRGVARMKGDKIELTPAKARKLCESTPPIAKLAK